MQFAVSFKLWILELNEYQNGNSLSKYDEN